ncbi:MAG TPA: 50S ribosomal protein L9 [Gammaproteobacteria bacterium]|nr:50S ribosomal protein L9 [Gammaproteobacteria bacterium]
MEVILLEKIRNLGALGDQVKVKAGYGRNFLVPEGKAVYATAENKAKFEARRAELEKAAAANIKAAETRKQALAALGLITLIVKVGEEGKLFGSIGTRDIASAITKAGVEVSKSEIHLPAGVLRMAGEYDIEVELHSDVVVHIKLNITSDAIAE